MATNLPLLYEGKAKKIYASPKGEHEVLQEFKDHLTAFNSAKKGQFAGKGIVNRNIASVIFRYLKKNGVDNHWVRDEGERIMVTRKVQIIPLEVVVRNIMAGSTCKRLGLQEGVPLKKPLIEFYFKKDELGDPFISSEQVEMLGVASLTDLAQIKEKALAVNVLLQAFFSALNIDLVDFKLEFGRISDGQILLADEISPDCCRLWDKTTRERLDKDRFRLDLGKVKESYESLAEKIIGYWEKKI